MPIFLICFWHFCLSLILVNSWDARYAISFIGYYLEVLNYTKQSDQCHIFIIRCCLLLGPSDHPSMINSTSDVHEIDITWDSPPCGTRCGKIVKYEYIIGKFGDQQTSGSTYEKGISFSSLKPHTDYLFQVRAVTLAGSGPYTERTTITTDKEPGKFINLEQYHNFYLKVWTVLSWKIKLIIMVFIIIILLHHLKCIRNHPHIK